MARDGAEITAELAEASKAYIATDFDLETLQQQSEQREQQAQQAQAILDALPAARQRDARSLIGLQDTLEKRRERVRELRDEMKRWDEMQASETKPS